MADVEVLRCAAHPQVETTLRCGKCERPICPRCLVHTPVGARCWECARLRTLPMFQFQPRTYWRALAAGLGVVVVGGLLWTWLLSGLGGFLGFFVALGMGYGTGEVISLAANRKRGLSLQIIAGVSVALSFLLGPTIVVALASLIGRGSLNIGLLVALAVQALLGLFTAPLALLMVALAVFVAVNRVR